MELSLIEVKVKFSHNSLVPFDGQFDSFHATFLVPLGDFWVALRPCKHFLV